MWGLQGVKIIALQKDPNSFFSHFQFKSSGLTLKASQWIFFNIQQRGINFHKNLQRKKKYESKETSIFWSVQICYFYAVRQWKVKMQPHFSKMLIMYVYVLKKHKAQILFSKTRCFLPFCTVCAYILYNDVL